MKIEFIRPVNYFCFALYIVIVGSYLVLEINSFVGDLPFFQLDSLLLFVNILAVPLLPLVFHLLI